MNDYYLGNIVPNKMGRFTWRKTSKAVKEYFIDLLGEKEANKLMTAMKRHEWIIIDGPHGPTGKTTLADILQAIGYIYVVENNYATTIRVDQPLKGFREKQSIFESLSISWTR